MDIKKYMFNNICIMHRLLCVGYQLDCLQEKTLCCTLPHSQRGAHLLDRSHPTSCEHLQCYLNINGRYTFCNRPDSPHYHKSCDLHMCVPILRRPLLVFHYFIQSSLPSMLGVYIWKLHKPLHNIKGSVCLHAVLLRWS